MKKKIILCLMAFLSVSACNKHHESGDKSGIWKFKIHKDRFTNETNTMILAIPPGDQGTSFSISCNSNKYGKNIQFQLYISYPGMTKAFVGQEIPVEYTIDDGSIEKTKWNSMNADDGAVTLFSDQSLFNYINSHKNGSNLYIHDLVSDKKWTFPLSGFSDFSEEVSNSCSQ